ncbi:MAG: outer membrane protein assembly factor BamA [Deltaproteobacteria bacterium RIFOXYD12_FULL_57_12]|nr:MAG: outer membrane protein assembly factor BamA [Deltaproteobacteria bacterium RIFOXYD12_FULL_57_12]
MSRLFLVLCCLGLALFSLDTGRALAAERPGTIVLPLKINTAVEVEQLTELADKTLQDVMTGSAIRRKFFRVPERSEAQQMVDYQATWPPAVDGLQKNADPSITYIVAGTLTRLGNKISIDLKLFDLLDPFSPAYFYADVKNLESLPESMDQLAKNLLGHVGRDFQIASIAPQGNQRIDAGAILRQIKSRAGDIYDPAALQEDLRNIFAMGYFDDVQIRVADTDKGKAITFEIKEKPVIGQVVIAGTDELKEETVREAITVVPNTIINTKKVKEAEESILKLYKEKGFYNTEVVSELTYPKPERVDIRFAIKEGSKLYIKEITFVGNKAFSNKELKKVLQTSEKGLFSFITDSGLLKREVLGQDASRLAAHYQNHGYIEAKVGEPEVTQKDNGLFITFNVFEGDRYRVGNIALSGDLIDEEKTLLDLLKLREEEFLSRKILREDILRLVDFYAERGYVYAEINPAIKENQAEKIVDISIDIQKNNLVHLGRIDIKGNTRTRDKVIRRELDIKEGGIFNSTAVRTSHQKLQRLDFFEDINITPEQTADKDTMDVVIEVKEKPTGAFSIGAGYSSVDNFMLMGEISQNNFLGKGQRVALSANMSSRTTRYNLSFTEPHYKDSQLLVGFDLYNWQKEYDDYTKDSYGGALRFSYPVWERWKVGFGYGFDNADLTDVKTTASQIIKDSVDIHITSYVTTGLTRDTLDKFLDPSKGSYNSVSVKYAGGPLGGDSAFTKVEGNSSWFFPMPKDTTFHFKLAAGAVTENSGGKLPVFEKFYLGGINTIRGFTSAHISPTDPRTHERIGGMRMWYSNTEWLFPLVKDAGLKGLLFFDAGNVLDDTWKFDTVKKSVGTGFRWLSPMGPLRLEWGYVLDPTEDEDQSNWDFSIGGSF